MRILEGIFLGIYFVEDLVKELKFKCDKVILRKLYNYKRNVVLLDCLLVLSNMVVWLNNEDIKMLFRNCNKLCCGR